MFIPNDFENIELNTFDECICSPILENEFRGIKINAPTEITMMEDYSFPVCGSYHFTEEFFKKFRSLENEIVIVVVDLKTHKSYSSNLLKKDFEPAILDDKENIEDEEVNIENEEEFEDVSISSWFNIDLFRYIEDLPRYATTFIVYATIGDFKSNVVTVKVVKP